MVEWIVPIPFVESSLGFYIISFTEISKIELIGAETYDVIVISIKISKPFGKIAYDEDIKSVYRALLVISQ